MTKVVKIEGFSVCYRPELDSWSFKGTIDGRPVSFNIHINNGLTFHCLDELDINYAQKIIRDKIYLIERAKIECGLKGD